MQRERFSGSARAPRSPSPSRILRLSSVPELASDRRERVVSDLVRCISVRLPPSRDERCPLSDAITPSMASYRARRQCSRGVCSLATRESRCGLVSQPAAIRHWTTAVVTCGEGNGTGALAPLLRGSAEIVYNAPGTLTSAFDVHTKSGFRLGVTSAYPEFMHRAGRESSVGRRRESPRSRRCSDRRKGLRAEPGCCDR